MTIASSKNLCLSVVTPTYNQASFLRDTIESVLGQDYAPIEYLVIDDGSTDGTQTILEEYTGQIQWETQPNAGQTPTINKGWRKLTGDVLTWLNSDDTFLPGAVRTAMDYLTQHPEVGIVFGDTLFTNADGSPLERSRPRTEFDYESFVVGCENPIAQPSAFIRRSVIEATGLLDPSFYYFMDWDYWLRAGLRCQVAYIPELLSTYRLHAESKTVAQAKRAAPELERMYQEFFARHDLPQQITRLRRRAMANMYFTSGGYYLQGGDRAAATRMVYKSLAQYPSLVFRPSMLHKALFCLLSGTSPYQKARSWWQRIRWRTPSSATVLRSTTTPEAQG